MTQIGTELERLTIEPVPLERPADEPVRVAEPIEVEVPELVPA